MAGLEDGSLKPLSGNNLPTPSKPIPADPASPHAAQVPHRNAYKRAPRDKYSNSHSLVIKNKNKNKKNREKQPTHPSEAEWINVVCGISHNELCSCQWKKDDYVENTDRIWTHSAKRKKADTRGCVLGEGPVVLTRARGAQGRLVCEIHSSHLTPLICVHSSDSVLCLTWNFPESILGSCSPWEELPGWDRAPGGSSGLQEGAVLGAGRVCAQAGHWGQDDWSRSGPSASHYISCKNEVRVEIGVLCRAARAGVLSTVWTQGSCREEQGGRRAWAHA